MPRSAQPRRYHFVDLLRGLAALVVVVCHYRWFFARFPGDWRTDVHLPGYSVLWPIYDHGKLAVPLFWVLSGFVFAIAYGRYGKGLSIFDFWLRRFSRLYPLHFLTLLIVAGLQAASMARFGTWQVYGNNDLPHFILQLFFASNWFTMTSSFNGPIWSVSIEELIYFVFLLYMKRFGLKLWPAIIIAAVSFAVERFTHNPVALCGALFFIGVIISRLRIDMLWWGLSGLLATAVISAVSPHDAVFIYLGAPSLLAVCVGLDRRFKLPERFHWFGLSTYSIYLWHMPLLIALRILGILPPLWLFVGVVLAIGSLSFRYIEAPAQQAIRSRGRLKAYLPGTQS